MKFYRDVLDGPLYIIVVIVSIILIMAIIGFIMERKRFAKDAANKVAHVDTNVAPIPEPVPEVKVEKPKPAKKAAKPKDKEVIDFTPAPEAPAKSGKKTASVNTEIPVFEAVANNEIKVEDKK